MDGDSKFLSTTSQLNDFLANVFNDFLVLYVYTVTFTTVGATLTIIAACSFVNVAC